METAKSPPGKRACKKHLVGAYLQEIREEWISHPSYMNMTEFQEEKAKHEQKEKASVKQPVNMAHLEAVAVSM